MKRLALIAVCLLPVAFAAPFLNDPYGTAEEALNATIWGLGARNLLHRGVEASVRGALVSPHPGTRGDGVYAHHPPLPVWLMVLPVALGGWEGLSRLLGLFCAVATLGLLARVLSRFFSPTVVMASVAAAAMSVFVLRYGRLFTTLTLAAPLFLGLLEVTVRRTRWPWWASLLVVALVLSSWDGVAAAGVLVIFQLLASAHPERREGEARRESKGRQHSAENHPVVLSDDPSTPVAALPTLRMSGGTAFRLIPLVAFVGSLAFVAWHLIDATHGIDELRWQFSWRASGDAITWSQWLQRQWVNVGDGVGVLLLCALFAAPLAWLLTKRDRRVLVCFALIGVPGVVMELVFRQGAVKHAFWGFNLILPASFAVAMALTMLATKRTLFITALLALAAQSLISAWHARNFLLEEREQNQVGALIADHLAHRGGDIAVLGRSTFHPHVSWYADAAPRPARTIDELLALALPDDTPTLVERARADELHCATSPDPARWSLTTLGEAKAACTR